MTVLPASQDFRIVTVKPKLTTDWNQGQCGHKKDEKWRSNEMHRNPPERLTPIGLCPQELNGFYSQLIWKYATCFPVCVFAYKMF